MMSGLRPSDAPAAAGDPTRLAHRGMWIAMATFAAAIVSTCVLVGMVLLSLDYDFDNGLMKPFGPAWGPLALVAFAAGVSGPVLSGRRWARWLAAAGFAAGAAWLLFRADLEAAWMPAALATAGCWTFGAVALAMLPSVGSFVAAQREQGGSYTKSLGPLASETDARRWLGTVEVWETAGLLSPRDRAGIARVLRYWADTHGSVGEDVIRAVGDFAPAQAPRGGRFSHWFARVRERWRGRRNRAGAQAG